jgi:antitoxin (DNA-binding transcriptional repressor) of toxin-antitoxin stability system
VKTIECKVGEFKSRFSEMVKRVERGESVAVTYGRKRNPVAMLVSPASIVPAQKRQLGKFADRLEVEFPEDWKMTEEEFLNG